MEKDKLLEKMYHNNNELNIDHLGCKMFLAAFKDDDIHKGLQKALFFVKMFTQASDVVLYKMDKYQNYNYYANGSVSYNKNNRLDIIIRQQRDRIENNRVTYYNQEDLVTDKEAILFPLSTHDFKYIIAIKNSNIENLYRNTKFVIGFTEYMTAILGQLSKSDKKDKEIYKDDDTGLDNRYSYNKVIKELNNSDDEYIYVLFDLYRLKYLNDNYSYQLGDAYIRKTAKILKDFFPKYHTYRDVDGSIKKKNTGSCIYRIGGDEFVLICKNDPLDVIEEKIDLVREEVENMDLNVKEVLNLGLNYGIASRINHETAEEMELIAGDSMKEDKAKMYKKFGDNRRR